MTAQTWDHGFLTAHSDRGIAWHVSGASGAQGTLLAVPSDRLIVCGS